MRKLKNFAYEFNPVGDAYAKLSSSPMNFFYHDDELAAFHIVDHPKKSTIYKNIKEQFIGEAEKTKNEMIKELDNKSLIPTGDLAYAQIMPKIYERLKMYTKEDLNDQLVKGVTWFSTNSKGNKYILITDNIRNVDNMAMKKADEDDKDEKEDIIDLKSSDWISKIALERMHPSIRPRYIIDEYNLFTRASSTSGDTFLMVDDGLYSGRQKTTSIVRLLSKQQKFTLYVIVPFFTQTAIDHMRNIFKAYKVSERIVKNDCIYWHFKNEDAKIYLWTGGTKMESTTDIVNDISGANFDYAMQMLFLTRYDNGKMSIKNEDTPPMYKPVVAATLTLFEHKVPDSISLVEVVGNYFAYKMAKHNSYNPPYKNLKHRTIGGMQRAPSRQQRPSAQFKHGTAVAAHQRTLAHSRYANLLMKSESNILTECKFDQATLNWFDASIDEELKDEIERNLVMPDFKKAKTLDASMMVRCGYVTTYELLDVSLENDDRLYLLLREIIARVAHRARSKQQVGNKTDLVGGGKRVYMKDLTVKELQARCVKRKIKYSGMRKAELIAALKR